MPCCFASVAVPPSRPSPPSTPSPPSAPVRQPRMSQEAPVSPLRQQMTDLVVVNTERHYQLIAMGYDPEAAANALIATNNNVSASVEVLLRAAAHDAHHAQTDTDHSASSAKSPSMHPVSPSIFPVHEGGEEGVEMVPIRAKSNIDYGEYFPVAVVQESPPAYLEVDPGVDTPLQQYDNPPPIINPWALEDTPPPLPMPQWYFKMKHETDMHGPVAEVILADLVRSGEIKGDDLVYSPTSSPQWQSLYQVPAFFNPAQSPSPPAPFPTKLPLSMDRIGSGSHQRASSDLLPLMSPPALPTSKRPQLGGDRASSENFTRAAQLLRQQYQHNANSRMPIPARRAALNSTNELLQRKLSEANDRRVAQNLSRQWQEEDEAIQQRLVQEETDHVTACKFDVGKFECPICIEEFSLEDVVIVQACVDARENAKEPHHKVCRGCYLIYVKSEISDGKVPVTCAMVGCKAELTELEINILTDDADLLSKYQLALFNKWVEGEHKGERVYHCGTVNCRGVLIVSIGEVEAQCGACRVNWCTQCVVKWHNNLTCEAYQKWRAENDSGDSKMADFIKESGLARCPSCGNGILKTYGCNHMTCRCGTHLCYLCKTQLPAETPYVHFNDPKNTSCYEKLFTGKEYEE